MLIRIGRHRHINPAYVVFMEWDRRFYANGSDSALVITMHDGTQHRVEHQPGYLDGADAYAVEKAILAAQEAGAA